MDHIPLLTTCTHTYRIHAIHQTFTSPSANVLLANNDRSRLGEAVELLREVLQRLHGDVRVQLARIEVPERLRVLERVLLEHVQAVDVLVPGDLELCAGRGRVRRDFAPAFFYEARECFGLELRWVRG